MVPHEKCYWTPYESILTCLAIPKSANLTTPWTSTSRFAPLISLQVYIFIAFYINDTKWKANALVYSNQNHSERFTPCYSIENLSLRLLFDTQAMPSTFSYIHIGELRHRISWLEFYFSSWLSTKFLFLCTFRSIFFLKWDHSSFISHPICSKTREMTKYHDKGGPI